MHFATVAAALPPSLDGVTKGTGNKTPEIEKLYIDETRAVILKNVIKCHIKFLLRMLFILE